MAAVDQRLGVVRRGVTPAAPKPINLPSQKFENHQLIPDVEIVPRGTCCWGSAGKSIPVSGKNNERPDSASPPSEIIGTDDYGSRVQTDSGLTVEAQSLAEESDLACTVESSIVPASFTTCVTVAEADNACPSLGVDNSIAKAGKDSSADSDAGTFPESVSRPSSTESYSGSFVTASARVEEQKYPHRFSQVCSDDHEKISNFQVKQETHLENESPRGSQDFGYFEGVYSAQSPFCRSGVPCPNGLGMACGPGMHPEPSHHYSFLGVPYYDSVKDKEIVVITMVGSPGVYGNYLPYPGFPDQYGRPSVFGNFPLQFGHFENFVGPEVTVGMDPICSGEDSGYVCNKQDSCKRGWASGSLMGTMERDNNIRFSHTHSMRGLYPISDDCSVPKRTGRQKSLNRNRRATLREVSPAVFPPERRVTLLTKVSQHEVIITGMQRKSKYGGIRQAKCTSSPPFFAEDITEVLSVSQPAQNSTEILTCAPQHNDDIQPRKEAYSGDGAQNQSGASHRTMGQAALESTETALVGEVVDIKESCTPHMSEDSSSHGSLLLQAVCKESNGEDSLLEPRYHEDAKTAVSEPSAATSICTPSPTSTPEIFQTQNRFSAQEQESPAACSPTECCQVPGSHDETFIGSAHNINLKPEVSCVSKVSEIQPDCSFNNLTRSAAHMELACEHVNESGTSSTSTVGGFLQNEHTGESVPKLAAQKSNKMWRRKGSVDAIRQGHGGSNQNVQDFVDKRAFTHHLRDDISTYVMPAADKVSLPSSPRITETLSESNVSLSYCAPVTLSSHDNFAAFSRNGSATVSLVDTEVDTSHVNKSSELHFEAEFLTTSDFKCVPGSCPTQVLGSSMNTSSASGGQTALLRIVSCGAGKKWRPKLSGTGGHDTKVFGAKTCKVAAAPAVSGFPVRENDSVKEFSGSVEVSCDNNEEDNYEKQLRVVEASKYLQDGECGKLSNMGSSASKVPCIDFKGERSCQKQSHNVEPSEDVQGDIENKLLQMVQKQQRSEDLSLTHGSRIKFEKSKNAEDEFNFRKFSFPKNLHFGKQGHTWRIIGKQMRQHKAPLVSKPEELEHSNSVVKGKGTVNVQQGVLQQSWKPKRSCSNSKASFDEVKDHLSNLALQNRVSAVGKEQGNRRPFSMKNFANDDNRKASQPSQPLSNNSIQMKHMVRENMYAAGIGYEKSQSSSRTYERLERRGEFLVTKKVDKKGWVVKIETAHSKA